MAGRRNGRKLGPGDPDYRPARGAGGAGAGNKVARRHGARSEREVGPRAEVILAAALAEVDYLADRSFRPALERWARSEARLSLLDEYLEEHGQLDEEGNPRPALEMLRKFESIASNERSRLGLDPLSRMRLMQGGAAASVDMARLMAQVGDG